MGVSAFSQPEETADPKAAAILKSLSQKTKGFKTIKAECTVTTYDQQKKPVDNQKATLSSKGSKYRLEIKNQIVICDSTTTWTYLKDANEVQINNVDESDKSSITPNKIFTIYESGFKCHLESEKTEGGVNVAIIDLYPKHPEKQKYHTLKLKINKDKNQIMEVQQMMKDGTMVVYTITNFVTNSDLPSSTFIFDKKDFPGVEVEDLRN